ncbi:unnamed protein product [Lampetra planeri]
MGLDASPRYGRCERKINRPRVQSHDLNMDHEAAGIISRRAVKSGRFLLDEALGQRGASIQPSSTSEGGGGGGSQSRSALMPTTWVRFLATAPAALVATVGDNAHQPRVCVSIRRVNSA